MCRISSGWWITGCVKRFARADKSHNDFAVQMGHDAVIVDPIFKKERVGDESLAE